MFLSRLIEAARELYDPLAARMYLATIVGRFGARTVYGYRRAVPCRTGVPTELLNNTSKDRALLGYIETPPPTFGILFLASSPHEGNAMPIVVLSLFPPTQDPTVVFTPLPARQTFVLKPSEQLFGTNLAPATLNLRVSSEYF